MYSERFEKKKIMCFRCDLHLLPVQTKKMSFTFTTLWPNSADKKLVIFFLFFPEKQDLTFHANCLQRLTKECAQYWLTT